jgi:hypothetical protein
VVNLENVAGGDNSFFFWADSAADKAHPVESVEAPGVYFISISLIPPVSALQFLTPFAELQSKLYLVAARWLQA